jgi:hypothetical protein
MNKGRIPKMLNIINQKEGAQEDGHDQAGRTCYKRCDKQERTWQTMAKKSSGKTEVDLLQYKPHKTRQDI